VRIAALFRAGNPTALVVAATLVALALACGVVEANTLADDGKI